MGEAATSDAAEAVTITGVTKRFDSFVAVDNIDLGIADGEFFALLGPSGCGKTTTLRMIAGLEFPTEGSLKIFGREVGTEPPNKRPVNTVFQNYALFPHMNVADNVGFGLKMQGVGGDEARRRSMELIDLVQLGGMESRKPSQLSGGQQQRVALARALVNQPKVLLLDEPLGALDLKLRQDMQHELKSLQRELGVSFVFVTHDQEEALTMSDRIAVMHSGRLLQVGSAEDLYQRPANRFVADFIGQTNLIPATVTGAGSVTLNGGPTVDADHDSATGADVAVSLRPEAITIIPAGADSQPGAVKGVVSAATYLGHAVDYVVDVGWARMEVRSQAAVNGSRHAPGDEVFLTWPRAANWVVTE